MSRYAKLELEDSPGNGATTTNVFGTAFYLPATEVALNPKPQPLDRSDEQRGVDGRLKVARNEYAPDGSIAIRSYARYLGALLMLLYGDVTTTAGGPGVSDPDGNNVPVGCSKHVFVKKTGATPKTGRLTLAYGSQWVQGRGVSVPSIAFSLEEDGVRAAATLMANFVSRLTADPAFTASYEDFDILPWRRRNVQVTWPIGSANIESIAFTLAQSLEYVRDLGDVDNAGFPSDTERANSPQGFLGMTGTLTRRDFDGADWEAAISAESLTVKVLLESEQVIGATAYPYRMFVQAPGAQYTDQTLEGLKNQPRHQNQLEWAAGYDEEAGYDHRVTLINDVTAYK